MDGVSGEGRLDIVRRALERIPQLLKIHPCEAHNLRGQSERFARNNDLVTSEGDLGRVSIRSWS